MKWVRARFKANYDDSRPIKFPPPGPWWESGFAADESYSIVIAYVKTIGQIKKYWPEADDITTETVNEISFSDRFPKPEWWNK